MRAVAEKKSVSNDPAHLPQETSSPEILVEKKISEVFCDIHGPLGSFLSYLSVEDQINFSVTNSYYRDEYERSSSKLEPIIREVALGKIEDEARFDDILSNPDFLKPRMVEEVYKRIQNESLAMRARVETPAGVEMSAKSLKEFLRSHYPQKKAEGELHFADVFLDGLDKEHPLNVEVQDCKDSTDYVKLTTIGKADKINRIIANYIQANRNFVQGLRALNLSGKQISNVPDWIRHLISLKVLNLSHNSISYLPPNLFDGRNLQVLDLSHNSIPYLPRSLFGARNLQVLDLSHNSISYLPPNLFDNRNLLKFSIEGNYLKELPKAFFGNEELLIFNAKKNRINKIPLDFLRDTKGDVLREVLLSGNKIASIPKNHPFLQLIEDLYKNHIKKGNHIGSLDTESEMPFDLKKTLPFSFRLNCMIKRKIWKLKKRLRINSTE